MTGAVRGRSGAGYWRTSVAPAVNVTGTVSVVSVVLAVVTLAVVESELVLQVTVSVGGSTVSERGFLLGGSSQVGGIRFDFWC